VGGTCGSVHAQTLNNNLKELGVIESKRNTVWKGLVHELLNAQDTVLCSYFAQRSGERGEGRSRKSTVGEAFQGLDYLSTRRGPRAPEKASVFINAGDRLLCTLDGVCVIVYV
jgi:hypothetical protein